ncbi:hypothetical protein ON010_g6176 [Phytophthora cinnamomi]|nr:hypothetical protein ON010_g6176 [Phytophthora cinnamomi]
MFKQELKKMHERMRTYSEKLNRLNTMIHDIHRLDYIKFRLQQLDSTKPYRFLCCDPKFKNQIEEIFDLPIDECQAAIQTMFPNFTSLADRERKRVDLLERTQRRVRQKNVAREMYAEASWASDVGKTVSISQNSTQDASNQVGDGDLKKPAITVSTQATDTAPDTAAGPEVVASDTINSQAPTVASTAPTEESRGVPEVNIDENELSAKKWIRKLYRSNKNWVSLKFHPIKVDGTTDTKYYVGPNGKLYNVKTNRKSISKFIDWVKTSEALMVIQSDAESNSLDEVSLMRMEDDISPGHEFKTEEKEPENEARNALIEIFKIYPVLNKLALHPIDKNGRQLTKLKCQLQPRHSEEVRTNKSAEQAAMQTLAKISVKIGGINRTSRTSVRVEDAEFRFDPEGSFDGLYARAEECIVGWVALTESNWTAVVTTVWSNFQRCRKDTGMLCLELFSFAARENQAGDTTWRRATRNRIQQAAEDIDEFLEERPDVQVGVIARTHWEIAQAHQPAGTTVAVPEIAMFRQMQHVDAVGAANPPADYDEAVFQTIPVRTKLHRNSAA